MAHKKQGIPQDKVALLESAVHEITCELIYLDMDDDPNVRRIRHQLHVLRDVIKALKLLNEGDIV
tara:strand:- start:371 stop:565 length:195 start_codon:yes stop_codon:yes gene_type:complete